LTIPLDAALLFAAALFALPANAAEAFGQEDDMTALKLEGTVPA